MLSHHAPTPPTISRPAPTQQAYQWLELANGRFINYHDYKEHGLSWAVFRALERLPRAERSGALTKFLVATDATRMKAPERCVTLEAMQQFEQQGRLNVVF